MSKVSNLQKESLLMLKETSRTFFIPISFLEPTLKKTVGSAYLCMRAIDEIEDHPELEDQVKINLLRSIQEMLATDLMKSATWNSFLLMKHPCPLSLCV